MKTLDKGKDKIQKICDVLRQETLEPAKEEAEDIIAAAKASAMQIISGAEAEAEKINVEARKEIEKERNVFQSTLGQAAKQSLEVLRQEVEKNLFSDELQKAVQNETSKPQIIADIIKGIVKSIEKEGLSVDFEVIIPKVASTDEINVLIGEKILQRLTQGAVTLGDFAGGAQVKLHDKKITIDVTDEALFELMGNYVHREDFRKLLFK